MNLTIDKANKYIIENKNAVNPTQRHLFHLSPLIGWMNDPNGVNYYKGQYHVFYQYYPYDSQWGPMHWGHATSKDLLNWKHLPVALAPDLDHEDGCFSGGSIVHNNQLYLLYTSHFNNGHQKQEQSLAISDDGIHFNKYQNKPVITIDDLPPNASKVDFRDPNPVEIDSKKFVLIGSTTLEGKGQILVYKTEDYIKYEFLNAIANHPLFGDVAECPDLFELNGKHVLLFSATNLKQQANRFKNVNSSLYAIGHFDTESGTFEIENIDEIDLGHHFYAPQTLLNKDKERIMIAWMEMWKKPYYTHDSQHKWVGATSLPRILSVVGNRLIQKPIDTSEFFNQSKSLKTDSISEINKVFHLKLSLSLDGETVIRLNEDDECFVAITVNAKEIILDTSHTKLLPFEKRFMEINELKQVDLDLFMDNSSLELFVEGLAHTITTRTYFDSETINISFSSPKNIIEAQIKEHIK